MSNWNNVYSHDECGICITPYTIDDNITWFPCNHCVCLKCYLKCSACPMCRAAFDVNIKPPIYKKINDITIQIKRERSNNNEPLNMINTLNILMQYV